jgi:ankyrin repeat protein
MLTDLIAQQICTAASDGDIHTLRTYVVSAEFANARDSDQWTALMRAASQGYLDCAKFLLEQGANVNTVQFPDQKNSDTAIDIALWNAKFDMVELLLAHQAKFNFIDAHGCTALITVMEGAPSLPEALIEPVLSCCSDAILNSIYSDNEINEKGTALWFAARYGLWSLVRGILKRQPQYLDMTPTAGGFKGLPAIDFALADNQLDIAKEMLTQGARLDYFSGVYESSTPELMISEYPGSGLMIAVQRNIPEEWTDLVLSRVSDDTLNNKAGSVTYASRKYGDDNALSYAAKRNNWQLVKGILSRMHQDRSQRRLNNAERCVLDLALRAARWDVIFVMFPSHAERMKQLLGDNNKPTSLKKYFEIFFIISQHYEVSKLPLFFDPELFWEYFKNTDNAATTAFFKKFIYLREIDVFRPDETANFYYGRRLPREMSEWASTLYDWATSKNMAAADAQLVMERMLIWSQHLSYFATRNQAWRLPLPTAESDYDKFIADTGEFFGKTIYISWIQRIEFVTALAQFCENGLQKPLLATRLYELILIEQDKEIKSRAKTFDFNQSAASIHRALMYLAPTTVSHGVPQDENATQHCRNFLEHAVSAAGSQGVDDEKLQKDCEEKAAQVCEIIGVKLSPKQLACTPQNFVNLIFELAEVKNREKQSVREEKQINEVSSSGQMLITNFFAQQGKRDRGVEVGQEESIKKKCRLG